MIELQKPIKCSFWNMHGEAIFYSLKKLVLCMCMTVFLSACQGGGSGMDQSDLLDEVQEKTPDVTSDEGEVTSQEDNASQDQLQVSEAEGTKPLVGTPELKVVIRRNEAGYIDIKNLQGKPLVEGQVYEVQILEKTDFILAIEANRWSLINTETLKVITVNSENDLYHFMAGNIYPSKKVLQYDPVTYKYYYLENEQRINEEQYAYATQFRDGYAVVLVGEMYDGTYQIVNEDLEVMFSTQNKIIAFGEKLFGEVQGYPSYLDRYNRIMLMNHLGVKLYDKMLFEVHPIDENLLLVGDHLKRWYINLQGDSLPGINQAVTELSASYNVTYQNKGYWVASGGNEPIILMVIDDQGSIVEMPSGKVQNAAIDLGDGIAIEDFHVVDERFTQKHLPQITVNGETAQFDAFNKNVMTTYFEGYVPESIEDVYNEINLTYNITRQGSLLDIDFNHYWYGFGAAHPNHYMETMHLDLETGEAYSLDDLALSSTVFDFFTTRVRQMAEMEPEMYFDIGEIYVDETTQYRHIEGAIQFYYSPYEIAPYAAGYPEFVITYEEMSQYLDTGSKYYKSLFESESTSD